MSKYIELESAKAEIRRAYTCIEDRCNINSVLNHLPTIEVSEELHREKEQAYMKGYEDGRKSIVGADYISDEYKELLDELLEVGYPHNWQHEASHIQSYMRDISKVIKKAWEIKDNDKS